MKKIVGESCLRKHMYVIL